MKTLEETLQTTLEMADNKSLSLVSQDGSLRPSKSSLKTVQPDAGRTASDIEQFTAALSQACVALKQYGKSPAELRALRDMFLTVLADIPASTLTKALFIHLNKSDEIPTPRQLREIVHPPKPVWKPDWAVYVALKKKIHDGYFPLSDERQFLRECEAYAMERRGEEMAEYEKAKLEVQGYARIGMYD